MKYHWIEKFRFKTSETRDMSIPVVEEKPSKAAALTAPVQDQDYDPSNAEEGQFDPELVTDVDYTTVISTMDKEQIVEKCTELYSHSEQDKTLAELAIGDCVVSNYNEADDTTDIKSSNNRQIQIQKKNATIACWRDLQLGGSTYSKLEQQLLIGVCVSDRLNRE